MMGITIKNMKSFMSREGYGFTASIYLDGKQVGTVTDAAYGGCYDYCYKSPELQKKVEDRIKSYYKENPTVDTIAIYVMDPDKFDVNNLPRKKYKDMLEPEDCFFYELSLLKDYEKKFKKAHKVGGFTVILDYYNIEGNPTQKTEIYTAYREEQIEQIKKMGKKKNKTAHVKVFRTLNDFNN